MRQAEQVPFSADLVEATQQELPEATDVFHQTEYRFHNLFSFGVTRTA